MAYITDPTDTEPDPHDVFDPSDVFCPKCGGPGDVTQYPRGNPPRLTRGGGWSGSWFGGRGKARCLYCGLLFSIEIEPGGQGEGE